MASYDVEILQSTNNLKALHVLSQLTGWSVKEVRRRLRELPLKIKEQAPLSEAVTCERQMQKIGLKVRLARVEVTVDDSPEPALPSTEVRSTDDEIIEIPETEIRVFPMLGPPETKTKIRRKRITLGHHYWHLAIALAGVSLFLLMLLYYQAITRTRHQHLELTTAVEQWSKTLNQQEAFLDQGVSPQQIFNKLVELDNKINRLLALLKPTTAIHELKARYQQAKTISQSSVRDLDFRRDLENANYPIHPTCLVDRGFVVGSSELPDGTQLRIQLFGEQGIDTVRFSAQIQDGVFRLPIEAEAEHNIFDALATIAPYSQQPPGVQKWAQETFALTELPAGAEKSTEAPTLSPPLVHTPPPAVRPQIQSPPPSPEVNPPVTTPVTLTPATLSRDDSLADAGLVSAFQGALKEWNTALQTAQKQLSSAPDQALEEIYQKLLQLEKHIDHLIQLLKSEQERNRLILAREDAYGQGIVTRQELESWHEEFQRRNNPFYLETALRRNLAVNGLQQAQVLVLDSPNQVGAFIIELEADGSNREALYPLLAQVLAEETQNSLLQIEFIRFRAGGQTLYWSREQIEKARRALNHPDGAKRCVEILGRNGITPPSP